MKLRHESIPGVTPPPREHTRAFHLIGYDSVNARVQGHDLKTNAQPLAKGLGQAESGKCPTPGRF